jgi:hypothetical protein
VQARPVRETPGEAMAATMQLAITLLTAGLDSSELEAWPVDTLTPADTDGLADFMASAVTWPICSVSRVASPVRGPLAAMVPPRFEVASRRPGIRSRGQCHCLIPFDSEIANKTIGQMSRPHAGRRMSRVTY